MAKVFITQERQQIAELTDRIIGRRKRLRKSQADMSKVLGKARNTYSVMERNLEKMPLEDLLIVLHELGFDMSVTEQQTELARSGTH